MSTDVAAEKFVEPARLVPRSWGSYELRYGLGLAALLVGTALEVAYFFVLPVVAAGVAIVLVLGSWALLPGNPRRRLIATLISAAALAGGLLGPAYLGLLAIAWIVGRSRPLKCVWVGLVAPIALSFFPFGVNYFPFDQALWLASGTVLAVALAWVARAIAIRFPGRTPAEVAARALAQVPDREAADAAWRVDEIKKWEDAYAKAHDGARPPAGFMPPIAAAPPSSSLPVAHTNTLAILALIFGIGGSPLAVLFGHLGHSQIRRSHERGGGMATAGLILGYLWIAAYITAVIVFLVIGRH